MKITTAAVGASRNNIRIPFIGVQKVRTVQEGSHTLVVTRYTIELPARHQVLIPMCTKDKDPKDDLFESTKTPGGVLMTKTAVKGSKDSSFWVKAINLTFDTVTIFKNQRTCVLSDIEDISKPMNANIKKQIPSVSSNKNENNIESLKELEIDLSKNQLSSNLEKQLENLILSYSDMFFRNKRDLRPDAIQVEEPPRRIPFAHQEGVKKDRKSMLSEGVIEKPSSEWASPLVLVRKLSGGLRICVDYRKLNDLTSVTNYPLPHIT